MFDFDELDERLLPKTQPGWTGITTCQAQPTTCACCWSTIIGVPAVGGFGGAARCTSTSWACEVWTPQSWWKWATRIKWAKEIHPRFFGSCGKSAGKAAQFWTKAYTETACANHSTSSRIVFAGGRGVVHVDGPEVLPAAGYVSARRSRPPSAPHHPALCPADRQGGGIHQHHTRHHWGRLEATEGHWILVSKIFIPSVLHVTCFFPLFFSVN